MGVGLITEKKRMNYFSAILYQYFHGISCGRTAGITHAHQCKVLTSVFNTIFTGGWELSSSCQ